MVVVKKQKGESDERLIARFKKKIIYSGKLFEMRERERHTKDSEKRKDRKYRLKHEQELRKKRDY